MSNQYLANQLKELEHSGVQGQKWYKHIFGKWQNQARYSNGIIKGSEEKKRMAVGKEEKKKRDAKLKEDKTNYDIEKGHNQKYYDRKASSNTIRNISDKDLKAMKERLGKENELKKQIHTSRDIEKYSQKDLLGLLKNLANGNAQYDHYYKSIYKNRKNYSDAELLAITNRLKAENEFRTNVKYASGKLNDSNYIKLLKEMINVKVNDDTMEEVWTIDKNKTAGDVITLKKEKKKASNNSNNKKTQNKKRKTNTSRKASNSKGNKKNELMVV